MPDLLVELRSFSEMDDDEFEAALRDIVTTSATINEVRDRLAELGYPYSISISCLPMDTQEALAAGFWAALLGGISLSNGDAVMVMAYGPSGEVVNL